MIEDARIAPAAAGGADPGVVLATGDGRITVACGEGTVVEILRLVPEGSRSMSAADYLRGSQLRPGLRLG